MTPDDRRPTTTPPPAAVVAGIRRTRRALWIAVGVAVPVFLLVVVLATRPSASTREVRSPLLGKAAPAAESTTIDGEAVKLSDLEGQWVVVNFFATWCVPCRIEHGELEKFHQAHQAPGDASVLGGGVQRLGPGGEGVPRRRGGDVAHAHRPQGQHRPPLRRVAACPSRS